jgi:anti-anti-sigma regulatory factor
MTATIFCDSSGISMLVRAHKQAAANRTEVRLAVLSTAVLRALTLVEIDHLLPIYPTLSQALAARSVPGPHTPTSDHEPAAPHKPLPAGRRPPS